MRKTITLPLTAQQARELRVGDDVVVSGRIVTARERAHRLLAGTDDPALRAVLEDALVYHCAPVVSQDPTTREYRVVAAGPTASIRLEPYQADAIARYGLRGVIGKGGMGPRTLAALAEHGAVYLHAVGGLAVVLARAVTRVRGVHKLDELGVPEALWELEVEAFPAVVTMDAHGQNLHETIGEDAVARELIDRRLA
jgi:fumarate hydratase class I